MGRLSKEGDLWLGLRSVCNHRRGPLAFIMRRESGRNKITKRFEETHKVKRWIYFVKHCIKTKPHHR